jgi:hypothetical protein
MKIDQQIMLKEWGKGRQGDEQEAVYFRAAKAMSKTMRIPFIKTLWLKELLEKL